MTKLFHIKLERKRLICQAFDTLEGRIALKPAMIAPIRRALEYTTSLEAYKAEFNDMFDTLSLEYDIEEIEKFFMEFEQTEDFKSLGMSVSSSKFIKEIKDQIKEQEELKQIIENAKYNTPNYSIEWLEIGE